jgi:hypothetical protein
VSEDVVGTCVVNVIPNPKINHGTRAAQYWSYSF